MASRSYFVVTTRDKPDALGLRLEVRPQHRVYLREQRRVDLHAAGPLRDEVRDAMDGSFFLLSATCREDVEAFLADDPYNRSGLTASTVIRRLDWTLGAPDAMPQAAIANSI